MSYEERLKKILGSNDPFWYTTIDNFVKTTYEDKEQGINDIEKLAKNSAKFNEFTKQIIKKRDDLKSIKEEFFLEKDINIQNIIISTRIYNGHYRKGSIFNDLVEFKFAGKNAIVRAFTSFCIDEKIKDKATLECYIPFSLNEEEFIKINNLITEIKSKYQPYDITAPRKLIPEYLKYTDLKINDINYAINSTDEILTQLRGLIKYNLIKQSLSKLYTDLISIEEK